MNLKVIVYFRTSDKISRLGAMWFRNGCKHRLKQFVCRNFRRKLLPVAVVHCNSDRRFRLLRLLKMFRNSHSDGHFVDYLFRISDRDYTSRRNGDKIYVYSGIIWSNWNNTHREFAVPVVLVVLESLEGFRRSSVDCIAVASFRHRQRLRLPFRPSY